MLFSQHHGGGEEGHDLVDQKQFTFENPHLLTKNVENICFLNKVFTLNYKTNNINLIVTVFFINKCISTSSNPFK